MGRLFLFAAMILGVGFAASGRHGATVRVIPAAPRPEATATSEAIAYRPGEPQLVPGQATELQRGANGHFTTSATVNGQPIEMLVDTGATSVALSVDDARRLGLSVDPARFAVVGSGASGPVRGVGVTLADVAVDGKHVGPVDAVVLDGLDRSLLGQSYLRRLTQVEISGDTMTLR